ncbi:hypothetical protein GCM10027032_22060 [Simplicispira piscis]
MTVLRTRPLAERWIAANAEDGTRDAYSNGFKHVIEAAVLNGRVWWVDENEIAVPQLRCNFVGIPDVGFPDYLGVKWGNLSERCLYVSTQIALPAYLQVLKRRVSWLEWLCCMARGRGAFAGGRHKRGKADFPIWRLGGNGVSQRLNPSRLNRAVVVSCVGVDKAGLVKLVRPAPSLHDESFADVPGRRGIKCTESRGSPARPVVPEFDGIGRTVSLNYGRSKHRAVTLEIKRPSFYRIASRYMPGD